MSLRRKTVSWSWCVAAAGVFSCSVFPDEATLPQLTAGASVGGSSVLPTSGAGGDDGVGVEPPLPGGAGGAEGGTLPFAGASAAGGAPPLGMAGIDAGGAGPVPTCTAPQQTKVAITADTWIDAAARMARHGDDDRLLVVGGDEERRALLEVPLPVAGADSTLVKATLVLHLQANADTRLTKRQLRLHQLEHPVIEARASWNRWNNGAMGDWNALGGDFGPAIAQASVPAGTSEGTLSFDVTAAVRRLTASTPVPLSLILRENGTPPVAPAELAFTSIQGNASIAPTLIVEFCEP